MKNALWYKRRVFPIKRYYLKLTNQFLCNHSRNISPLLAIMTAGQQFSNSNISNKSQNLALVIAVGAEI